MTVIEISDEQAAALKAKAAAQGLTLERWLEKLAAEGVLPTGPAEQRPLQTAADIILGRMRNVPPDIMPSMPIGWRQPARSLHLRLAETRSVTALSPTRSIG